MVGIIIENQHYYGWKITTKNVVFESRKSVYASNMTRLPQKQNKLQKPKEIFFLHVDYA